MAARTPSEGRQAETKEGEQDRVEQSAAPSKPKDDLQAKKYSA
jgi:hypothetical protein